MKFFALSQKIICAFDTEIRAFVKRWNHYTDSNLFLSFECVCVVFFFIFFFHVVSYVLNFQETRERFKTQ